MTRPGEPSEPGEAGGEEAGGGGGAEIARLFGTVGLDATPFLAALEAINTASAGAAERQSAHVQAIQQAWQKTPNTGLKTYLQQAQQSVAGGQSIGAAFAAVGNSARVAQLQITAINSALAHPQGLTGYSGAILKMAKGFYEAGQNAQQTRAALEKVFKPADIRQAFQGLPTVSPPRGTKVGDEKTLDQQLTDHKRLIAERSRLDEIERRNRALARKQPDTSEIPAKAAQQLADRNTVSVFGERYRVTQQNEAAVRRLAQSEADLTAREAALRQEIVGTASAYAKQRVEYERNMAYTARFDPGAAIKALNERGQAAAANRYQAPTPPTPPTGGYLPLVDDGLGAGRRKPQPKPVDQTAAPTIPPTLQPSPVTPLPAASQPTPAVPKPTVARLARATKSLKDFRAAHPEVTDEEAAQTELGQRVEQYRSALAGAPTPSVPPGLVSEAKQATHAGRTKTPPTRGELLRNWQPPAAEKPAAVLEEVARQEPVVVTPPAARKPKTRRVIEAPSVVVPTPAPVEAIPEIAPVAAKPDVDLARTAQQISAEITAIKRQITSGTRAYGKTKAGDEGREAIAGSLTRDKFRLEQLKGELKSIPEYALGTPFHRGGFAWVGEKGRELVKLPRGAAVYPHGHPRIVDEPSVRAATFLLGLGPRRPEPILHLLGPTSPQFPPTRTHERPARDSDIEQFLRDTEGRRAAAEIRAYRQPVQQQRAVGGLRRVAHVQTLEPKQFQAALRDDAHRLGLADTAAQARETAGLQSGGQIYINKDVDRGYFNQTRADVEEHETAHIDANRLPREYAQRLRGLPESPPTRYAKTNTDEDFAESLRLYRRGGRGLDWIANKQVRLGPQRTALMAEVQDQVDGGSSGNLATRSQQWKPGRRPSEQQRAEGGQRAEVNEYGWTPEEQAEETKYREYMSSGGTQYHFVDTTGNRIEDEYAPPRPEFRPHPIQHRPGLPDPAEEKARLAEFKALEAKGARQYERQLARSAREVPELRARLAAEQPARWKSPPVGGTPRQARIWSPELAAAATAGGLSASDVQYVKTIGVLSPTEIERWQPLHGESLGVTSYRQQRIAMAPPSRFENLDAEGTWANKQIGVTFAGTLTHEVGHSVSAGIPHKLYQRFTKLRKRWVEAGGVEEGIGAPGEREEDVGVEGPPTLYAQADAREDFAESWRLHRSGGSGLDTFTGEKVELGPRRTAFMREVDAYLDQQAAAKHQTQQLAVAIPKIAFRAPPEVAVSRGDLAPPLRVPREFAKAIEKRGLTPEQLLPVSQIRYGHFGEIEHLTHRGVGSWVVPSAGYAPFQGTSGYDHEVLINPWYSHVPRPIRSRSLSTILTHEIGHQIEYSQPGVLEEMEGIRAAEAKRPWYTRLAARVGLAEGPTAYGRRSAREDVADSFEGWQRGAKIGPARAALIQRVQQRLERPQGQQLAAIGRHTYRSRERAQVFDEANLGPHHLQFTSKVRWVEPTQMQRIVGGPSATTGETAGLAVGSRAYLNKKLRTGAWPEMSSEQTLVHEIGHNVEHQLPPRFIERLRQMRAPDRVVMGPNGPLKDATDTFVIKKNLVREEPPTQYGRTNVYEDFADSFALHRRGGHGFDQWTGDAIELGPHRAALMRDVDAYLFKVAAKRGRIKQHLADGGWKPRPRVSVEVAAAQAARLRAALDKRRTQRSLINTPLGPNQLAEQLKLRVDKVSPLNAARELRNVFPGGQIHLSAALPTAEHFGFKPGTPLPEHIQSLVDFIQRQGKVLEKGQLTEQQVAAAYLVTLASIRGRARPVGGVVARLPEASKLGVQASGTSRIGGRTVVRPEDVLGSYLGGEAGQRNLAALTGRSPERQAPDEAIDEIEHFVGQTGFSMPKLARAYEDPIKGAYSLRNLPEATVALNRAGQSRSRKQIEATLGTFTGVGAGKTGFMGQWLGYGQRPTVDTNILQLWLGGIRTGQIAQRAAAHVGSGLGQRLTKLISGRYKEMRQAGVFPEVPESVYPAAMHQALFDASLGAQTTHKSIIEALDRSARQQIALGGRQAKSSVFKRHQAGYYVGSAAGLPIEIERAERAIEGGRGWLAHVDGQLGTVEHPTRRLAQDAAIRTAEMLAAERASRRHERARQQTADGGARIPEPNDRDFQRAQRLLELRGGAPTKTQVRLKAQQLAWDRAKYEAAPTAEELGVKPGDTVHIWREVLGEEGWQPHQVIGDWNTGRKLENPKSKDLPVKLRLSDASVESFPTHAVRVHKDKPSFGELWTAEHRKDGGDVQQQRVYKVGEQGEEWFVPDENGVIVPNNIVQRLKANIPGSHHRLTGGPIIGGPQRRPGQPFPNYIAPQPLPGYVGGVPPVSTASTPFYNVPGGLPAGAPAGAGIAINSLREAVLAERTAVAQGRATAELKTRENYYTNIADKAEATARTEIESSERVARSTTQSLRRATTADRASFAAAAARPTTVRIGDEEYDYSKANRDELRERARVVGTARAAEAKRQSKAQEDIDKAFVPHPSIFRRALYGLIGQPPPEVVSARQAQGHSDPFALFHGTSGEFLRVGAALFGLPLGINVAAGAVRLLHTALAQSADAAAELSRAGREIGAAFGSSADSTRQFARNLSDTSGFLQKDTASAALFTAELSRQYNFTEQQREQVQQLAADLARIHNIPLEQATQQVSQLVSRGGESQPLGINLQPEVLAAQGYVLAGRTPGQQALVYGAAAQAQRNAQGPIDVNTPEEAARDRAKALSESVVGQSGDFLLNAGKNLDKFAAELFRWNFTESPDQIAKRQERTQAIQTELAKTTKVETVSQVGPGGTDVELIKKITDVNSQRALSEADLKERTEAATAAVDAHTAAITKSIEAAKLATDELNARLQTKDTGAIDQIQALESGVAPGRQVRQVIESTPGFQQLTPEQIRLDAAQQATEGVAAAKEAQVGLTQFQPAGAAGPNDAQRLELMQQLKAAQDQLTADVSAGAEVNNSQLETDRNRVQNAQQLLNINDRIFASAQAQLQIQQAQNVIGLESGKAQHQLDQVNFAQKGRELAVANQMATYRIDALRAEGQMQEINVAQGVVQDKLAVASRTNLALERDTLQARQDSLSAVQGLEDLQYRQQHNQAQLGAIGARLIRGTSTAEDAASIPGLFNDTINARLDQAEATPAALEATRKVTVAERAQTADELQRNLQPGGVLDLTKQAQDLTDRLTPIREAADAEKLVADNLQRSLDIANAMDQPARTAAEQAVLVAAQDKSAADEMERWARAIHDGVDYFGDLHAQAADALKQVNDAYEKSKATAAAGGGTTAAGTTFAPPATGGGTPPTAGTSGAPTLGGGAPPATPWTPADIPSALLIPLAALGVGGVAATAAWKLGGGKAINALLRKLGIKKVVTRANTLVDAPEPGGPTTETTSTTTTPVEATPTEAAPETVAEPKPSTAEAAPEPVVAEPVVAEPAPEPVPSIRVAEPTVAAPVEVVPPEPVVVTVEPQPVVVGPVAPEPVVANPVVAAPLAEPPVANIPEAPLAEPPVPKLPEVPAEPPVANVGRTSGLLDWVGPVARFVGRAAVILGAAEQVNSEFGVVEAGQAVVEGRPIPPAPHAISREIGETINPIAVGGEITPEEIERSKQVAVAQGNAPVEVALPVPAVSTQSAPPTRDDYARQPAADAQALATAAQAQTVAADEQKSNATADAATAAANSVSAATDADSATANTATALVQTANSATDSASAATVSTAATTSADTAVAQAATAAVDSTTADTNKATADAYTQTIATFGKQTDLLSKDIALFGEYVNIFAVAVRTTPTVNNTANGQTTVASSEAEVENYIRQAAATRGIDPEQALRVARAEGSTNPEKWQTPGDQGSSFGPYQLHVGGIAPGGNAVAGLGDAFKAQTGLDATDLRNWRQQIDFALNQAATSGWAPWHAWTGAPQAGLSGAHPVAVSTVTTASARAADLGYSPDTTTGISPVVSLAQKTASQGGAATPYIWGGAQGRTVNPDIFTGGDCSGFVSWIYYEATGKRLPAYVAALVDNKITTKVDTGKQQPGDLAVYNPRGAPDQQHVGIYVGNNQMIDESTAGTGGVQYRDIRPGVAYYRVNDDNAPTTAINPSDLPKYALGTNWARGGWSLVGENGPEVINLPRGGTVTPLVSSVPLPSAPTAFGAAAGSAINIGNINVDVSGSTFNSMDDVERVARKVSQEVGDQTYSDVKSQLIQVLQTAELPVSPTLAGVVS